MSGKGSTFLEGYSRGRTLTPRQSILAKCAECTCDYTDGREDCEIHGCPLYPFQPYGKAPRAKRIVKPKEGQGIKPRQKGFISRK